MSEKTYILNVYNTMTGEFELVQVTKEVFQTYLRTGAVELQSPNEQREIFHLQSALWLSAR